MRQKIHKKTKKEQIKKEPQIQLKLRRGFKRCQGCSSQIHIHKKVCPNCLHSHEFDNVSKTKNDIKSNTLSAAKKIIDYSNKNSRIRPKKVPKRLLDSIYVIKKTLLNSNESNIDLNLLSQIEQEQITISDQKPFTYQLPKVSFIYNNQQYQAGQFIQDKKSKIIYFGLPIICIAIKDSIKVISLQTNQYDKQQYSYFHKINEKYEGIGLLGIINDTNQQITYTQHQYGCILQVKFNQFQLNNIVGTINASGNFTIFPLQSNQISNIIINIEIPNQLLSCFDWCPSKQMIVSIGDQQGNIYIIKIHQNSYQLINYLQKFHQSNIKDMQYYIHNDEQMPLLATAGYDGFVKIINPQQQNAIFEQNVSSKGILQIKWDSGGKYLIVIKDELYHRAQLITFFSVQRDKDSSQILQPVEQRFIQTLAGDDYTIRCAFHHMDKSVYFTSTLGTIYQISLEEVRKCAIKKEKKQSSSGIEIFRGQIQVDNKNIKLITDYKIEQQTNKLLISDWTQGFQMIDVDQKGNLIAANYLGLLLIM